MKNYPTKIIKLITTTFVLFLFFSCETDSDLLTDMVLEDAIVNETSINVNDAKITVEEDKATSFNMLNNATSKGSRRQYKSSKQPKNGGLVIQKDSIAVYTPDYDFNGKDAIEITLEETNEDNTTSDVTMIVEVTVNPTADVVDDKVETTQGTALLIEPLKNDNFNENSNVRISQTSNASKGSIVINEDNTLTYTPNSGATGIDLFTYTTEVTNLDESITTETGEITVTINSIGNSSSSTNTGDMGPLKAFPGAEGFGKNATGGRGGNVLFVTNLNDSGAGSLRAALEASGARTIIFRIGGTINLTSGITIQNPNLTIAGQTAPGGGILIKGGQIQISANNVIIRHIRFRPGRGASSNADALRIVSTNSSELKNIIIDHCSMSWANDENIGIGAINKSGIVSNITIQNSIIAEAGYGSLVSHRTYDVSFYNNYFAHNSDRNIRIGGYADQEEPRFALRAEFINNVVYGMGTVSNITYGQKYAAYGNKYKLSNVKSLAQGNVFSFTSSGERSGYRQHSNIYLNDNILVGNGSLEASNIAQYKSSAPFNASGIIPLPANTLENTLFNNVGAFPLDAVDIRLIAGYATGIGAGSQNYPSIPGGTAFNDTDNDGIDDSFEITKWNSLTNNNNNDNDGDGYTNIEEYLHYLTIN